MDTPIESLREPRTGEHLHEWVGYESYFLCACGKKRLRFTEKDGVRVGVRANGRAYTQKADQNRFFFPDEYVRCKAQMTTRMRNTCDFLIKTGLRINEARHVRVSDVDFQNGRIRVRVTKTKARKGETRGKQRWIPISSQFAKELSDYARQNKLLSSKGSIIDDQTFGIMTTSGVNMALKAAASKAGLEHPEDFSAHTFRKTLEVWLMSLGVGDVVLLAHFAHDLKTLSSHYVSPDIFTWDDKDKMRRIIGDLYAR